MGKMWNAGVLYHAPCWNAVSCAMLECCIMRHVGVLYHAPCSVRSRCAYLRLDGSDKCKEQQ